MNRQLETFNNSFDTAQNIFNNELDIADRSAQIAAGNQDNFTEVIRVGEAERSKYHGFIPVDIHLPSLPATAALYVNRVLLMQDPALKAYVPAIITADTHHGAYNITKIAQPFVPEVGFTDGMHFSVSLSAQTRAKGFGGHGSQGASGMEQGHFSAVLLGAHSPAIKNAIVANGDKASHDLLHAGVPDIMTRSKLLDVPGHVTKRLDTSKEASLRLFWHPGLEQDDQPVVGDYPDATRLMLGGALYALGERGQENAKVLVDDAVRGA